MNTRDLDFMLSGFLACAAWWAFKKDYDAAFIVAGIWFFLIIISHWNP